jgi:hypothetical protein
MSQPIHASLRGDPDALHDHLVADHGLPADDVPRTTAAREGVHRRIHDGADVPGATATHRAHDTAVGAGTSGLSDSRPQPPAFADHGGHVAAETASSADGASDATSESSMAASRLRDLLVDLVNNHASDTSPGDRLRAEQVTPRLWRDRHALDITDRDGGVWRVDVHDQPHRESEVAA